VACLIVAYLLLEMNGLSEIKGSSDVFAYVCSTLVLHRIVKTGACLWEWQHPVPDEPHDDNNGCDHRDGDDDVNDDDDGEDDVVVVVVMVTMMVTMMGGGLVVMVTMVMMMMVVVVVMMMLVVMLVVMMMMMMVRMMMVRMMMVRMMMVRMMMMLVVVIAYVLHFISVRETVNVLCPAKRSGWLMYIIHRGVGPVHISSEFYLALFCFVSMAGGSRCTLFVHVLF